MYLQTVNKAKTSKKKSVQTVDKTICINPGNGETIGDYLVNTKEDLHNAVLSARLAQPAWAALPVKKRAQYIIRIRDYIMDNLDDISETISRDNGKTRIDALATEVLTSTMSVTYYCKNAKRFLKDRSLPNGNIMFINKRSKIARAPWGVVGIISPWNYPFAIPFSEIVMALLAGNAVIFKAASETQVVGHALQQCIAAADLPRGIFKYINMPGSVAGDAFLEARIDKLFFTGSVKIGKYLMKKASETLTPVSLELGGNDPMIVCADADLKRAAAGAVWAGCQNAGQSCGGVERIYVERKAYNDFLDVLKKYTEALRVGYDTDHNMDIGAMTTKRQMDTVNLHIADSLKKGAKIYAQSKAPKGGKGQFLPCTVLVNVNHDMLVMKDETFGPVIGVMPFDTIDEAVELANDSYLGLTGSVWSKNRSRALKIARRIQAGAITVNDHLMSHGLAETPWGGFKESSIGRTHGGIGFDEMTQPQVLVNEILPFARKNFWWHPVNKKIYDGIKGVAQVLYAKKISERLVGMINLMKVFFRTFIPN
ncbi:MAG: aldehyde dehydrogenase family protein [Spirochaetes bacterium]|nr:aldehyde dehydrogenase family protein [Spirochaetota bacterium]